MKQICLAFLAATAMAQAAQTHSPAGGTSPITTPKDWLSKLDVIVEKDGKLDGRIQPRGGAVRPIASAEMSGSRLLVTQSGTPAVTWDLAMEGEKLTGTQKRGDTKDGDHLRCSGSETRPRDAQVVDEAGTAFQRERPHRLGAREESGKQPLGCQRRHVIQ